MLPDTETPGSPLGDERRPRFGSAANLNPPPEYLHRGPPSLNMAEGSGRGWWWWRVLPTLLALVTLGAFAAGVWFAYEQGVRQGLRLSPPLVRADPEPIKIEPADPGGLQILNQDRQIFEALEKGARPPRLEQLLPPPEVPIEVAPEPQPEPESEPEIVTNEMSPTAELSPTKQASPPAAAIPVLTPQELAAVLPVSQPPMPPVETTRTIAPVAGGSGEGSASGPTQLLLESDRIEAPVTSSATNAATAPAGPPALLSADPPPTPEPAPGFRMQLASYSDAESALAGWTVLQTRYPQILGSLRPTIVEANVGGRAYQRLQAGSFPTASAASTACGRLQEAGGDCLVVNP